MVISVPDDANPSPDRMLVVRSGERWLAVPLSRVIQASAVDRLTTVVAAR